MATRRLLAELIEQFEATSAHRVSLDSAGGVDVARRVRAREVVDVVVLAREVIDDLIEAERLAAGSRIDLAVSKIAVAVRAGTRNPDISTADAVRDTVLAARSIAYSTGPSGVHLAKVFEAWDTEKQLRDRCIIAPPGVPVGGLVARGEAEIGFQQLSELMAVDGIHVVGLLPPEIQAITTFSGAVARTSTKPDAAGALLKFMVSPSLTAIKQRYGMDAC
jgi:molybdate transport system substrate-binding protein